jgi:hypothetical protein
LFVAALALAPATVLSAQADPDRTVAGGGTLPTGWNARTDRNAPMANVKFAAMGTGFHVTLGPATIFWRDADTVSVGFHGVASFAQTKAPTHPEAYGLFLGGKNLGDSTQSYTYFLVRTKADTGQFSIWRRTGAGRPTAVVGWTTNAAVNGADAAGKATNELSFLVQGGTVKFMVNGKDVHTANATDVDSQGVVGYRINHNLEVHVGPLGVHRM